MPQAEIGRSEDMLEELAGWVRLETPTTSPFAVNALMDVAEGELVRAGAHVTRIPGTGGFGDCLVARSQQPGAATDKKPIVVAGHLDTVWAEGTLAAMPYRVDGDRAHGPGIYDMKAGSFGAFHALRAILRQKVPTRRPVVLLLTPDEEVGSPSSRALIEREGAQAAYVLIPEPANANGACVTARKGVGRFRMTIAGRGAHSGGAFTEGRSAISELAHQILAVNALVDVPRGVTLNVAPVWGGTRPNVIPPDAGCEIDLRVPDHAAGEALEAKLLGLRALTPDCTVTVEGGMNRPAFAENEGITALHARAAAIAERLGFAIPKAHRGGGSDGNFTAALGIPTLDGLGCPGAGAHVASEHIQWRQLAPRAALMAELMETLD